MKLGYIFKCCCGIINKLMEKSVKTFYNKNFGDFMLGIDIVNIKRIEKIYNKFGKSFLERIFNKDEITYIVNKNYNIETIAGLFAAKEAVSKSMQTGISKISFKDIKIYHENNSPYAVVFDKKFDLSISHEREYAVAVSNFKSHIEEKSEFKLLNKRELNTHKGDYGKVAIIAGTKGMTGSAFLSSNAALRTGSGLVYNIVPKDIIDIMSIKYIEVIAKSFDKLEDLRLFLEDMDSIAIGPGMGLGKDKCKLLEEVLKLDKKIVIDADGITNLSKDIKLLKNRKEFTTILTPHNAEFSRLSGYSINDIQNNREKLAKKFAKEYKCILLLKGNKTIVTDGERVYTNYSGNPGMATAGSGDVLTGIIVSLIARGIDIFEATSCGSYMHGRAGDLASYEIGEEALIASDIIKKIYRVIPSIIKE